MRRAPRKVAYNREQFPEPKFKKFQQRNLKILQFNSQKNGEKLNEKKILWTLNKQNLKCQVVLNYDSRELECW